MLTDKQEQVLEKINFFSRSLQRLIDGQELKEVICVTKKRFQEAPNENLRRETKNLIVEKDKGVSEKENRPTNAF